LTDVGDLPEAPPWALDASHDAVWRFHAACRDAPRDLWFEDPGGQAREAELICATCPVRDDCLQEAVLGPYTLFEFGIWGGASERFRRVLRRELAASPHPGRFYGPEGCRCRFCRGRVRLAKRLARLAAGVEPAPMNVVGPNATHGKASTYAAGCRCDPCREGMRAQRARRKAARQTAAEAGDGQVPA
jgi:WhiB family redox-sensing transcriptional regulator